MYKEVFRLAALLGFVALATSRLGLLGHEVVGHGGMAIACGWRVVDIALFWFAGGWIRYEVTDPSVAKALAIAMAGIGLELIVGVALCTLVRGDTLGRRLVRGIGLGLVVHATWYLATGAFHGFGDGLLLYRVLGAWRIPVAIAAGLATCTVTFVAARGLVGVLIATLPGSRRARITGVIAAALIAGGVHAGLAIGELRLRHDETYTSTMQHERDRKIAVAMQRWEHAHQDRSAADTRAERARLEREHRTFPFVWLLAAATAVSLVAGAWRPRRYPDEPISNRLVAIAGVVAAAAIGAVIAIGAVLTI